MNTPTTPTCLNMPHSAPALLPDAVLQNLATVSGQALEHAFHHGDREAAAIFMRTMNDITRLRCARRGAGVDIQSAGGSIHGW